MLLPNGYKLLHLKLLASRQAATPFCAGTRHFLMTPEPERPYYSAVSASTVQPANSWCVTASWDEVSHKVITTNIADNPMRVLDEKILDLTTSPDWMEYLEILEQRSDESGGAGAYDTFRCDLILGISENQWRIWGQEFHLNRIEQSYRSIVNTTHEDSLTNARRRSESIIQELLFKASTSPTLQSETKTNLDDVMFQLIRMTLLWSHSNDEIIVRGHSCCSGTAFSTNKPVQPIVVSVAAKQHTKNKQIDMDTTMPSRMHDPRHKVASWTRLRKQMERPETYKPPGVSEVLMLRPFVDNQLEVLEGLSSNVFVIYKDGTLRTAGDGVLHGYARHLVLECAESCGLVFDPSKSILLQDAEKGLWQEAFITSSSRLIYPISKVLIHTDNDYEFVEYWTYERNGEKGKCQQLLDEILKQADAEIRPV